MTPREKPGDDQQLIQYYRQRASEYEQIYYRDQPARRAELEANIEPLKAMVRDRTVLDLACGTGYWLEKMSETARYLVAADISREMIAEARGKNFIHPVDFVNADLHRAPFRDGQFEVVTLGFWYSHHPRQAYDDLFDTICRPLKSAGRVWMIDNNPPAEGITRESAGYDEQGNHYTWRSLNNGKKFVIMKNYPSEQELREALGARFLIDKLTFGTFYWSVELTAR